MRALNGTVDWHFQKDAAVRAVRDLTGVRGVTNAVMVKRRIKAGDVPGENRSRLSA